MNPAVAVIVVTYRQGPELELCLASVGRELAGTPHELWIVDNASRDGTAERAAQLVPAARVIVLPENLGFAAANNVALGASTAAAFLLLNPDAELLPGAYEALCKAAAAHVYAGAVAPQHLSETGAVVASGRRFPSLATALWENLLLERAFPRSPVFGASHLAGFDHRMPRWVDAASGACLFVPRRTMDAVGTLDAGYFMYCEEVDWCRRMRDAGLRVWFEPAARIRHLGQRSSGADQRTLIPAYYRSQRRYFRTHLSSVQTALLGPLVVLGAGLRIAGLILRRLAGRLDREGFRTRLGAFATVAREALAPLSTPPPPSAAGASRRSSSGRPTAQRTGRGGRRSAP